MPAAVASAPPAPAALRWPGLGRVFRQRRKLKFTRIGRWYCGLSIAIGMAAINTGNNLLFLVLGLMLSSIVVSGVLSEIALRDVQVERTLPAAASVGDEALFSLRARNTKQRAPSFSLELRESRGDVDGRAYLLFLPAGESHELGYRFTPSRRGLHRLSSLVIATRWPFGLFEKSREVEVPGELVVFPRRIAPPSSLRDSAGRVGERPSGRAGHGTELHALRDHRAGEDVRTVHWRSSARAGKLIGVEHEHERRRQVCVLLDQRGLVGRGLESAIERAAALVEREILSGADVALALSGVALPARAGTAQLKAALTVLALLPPAETEPGAPAPAAPSGAAVLVVGRDA